ncbi:AAA family ATPase [Microvirga terricola]|uniref:AAA family ATPase n=1 Tax=Microvirga terricola TaxID=2719797 RepID=A0ABX0VAU2_9HYPH|nr:AAA family ATPase [Microvirga terricola]NIX76949.1 AAA family ATPase [Microvirga terricola]
MRHVIFLNGPIGAGKTTLGRALAPAMNAAFIDSDDLRNHTRTWFGEILTSSRRLVDAALAALREKPAVVIAKPLRRRDWVFFHGTFKAQGIACHCVTLSAAQGAILAPTRGRVFDPGEQSRITEMIDQGYAPQPFSDLVIETDRQDFAETVALLESRCTAMLLATNPS